MQSSGENSNTGTDRNINSGEVNLCKCRQEPGSWEKTSPSWEADYQNISISTAAFLSLPPLQCLFPFFLVAWGTQAAAVPSLWFKNSLLPSMPVNSTTHFLLTKHPNSLNCVLWIYQPLFAGFCEVTLCLHLTILNSRGLWSLVPTCFSTNNDKASGINGNCKIFQKKKKEKRTTNRCANNKL